MTGKEKELIFAYFDGELGPREKALAESLLATDPECRRLLSQWKGLAKTFLKPPEIRGSERFVAEIIARIEQPEESMPGTRPADLVWGWLTPVLATAALILVLLPVRKERAPVNTETMLLSLLGANVSQDWISSPTAWPEAYLKSYLEDSR
jgi:anti-sigma factor RsiW